MRTPADIRRHASEVEAAYVRALREGSVTHALEREVIKSRDEVTFLELWASEPVQQPQHPEE